MIVIPAKAGIQWS